ncbi:DNA-binding transcriptional response regulator [Paraliomyxa miuraensis]|uniref:response regulator n=1 Tax=Paraliomyxa miuraensis TaxID=376150 RepID=UPI00224EC819|nr:response regulator [Paraliomyxa miuraensis]MCX4245788.1 response regulator [Paraliomyxa miuraensis]
MSQPRILFAHERRGVARAVQRVLEREGFSFEHAADGVTCARRLDEVRWAGLVVDVALPFATGIAGYELVQRARDQWPDAGAQVVILVASVYRHTSYKRRPTRLYGADDYVEIHHLCDQLPRKLYEQLNVPAMPAVEQAEAEAREQLRVEGDTRMDDQHADQRRLASLIVADMVLYNGDAIHDAGDLAEAESAVAPDLDIARQLFAQVVRAEGTAVPGDPIGEAFASLMGAMGRGGPT